MFYIRHSFYLPEIDLFLFQFVGNQVGNDKTNTAK